LRQYRHAINNTGFHEKFIMMDGTEADRVSYLRRNTQGVNDE